MKIEHGHGINQDRFISVKERGKESPSFQQVFQETQVDFTQERLQTLLKTLDRSGNRLSTSQSVNDLLAYKHSVQEFLKEVAQNGYSLKEYRHLQSNGREKRLKIIKQIDEQLIKLSEQVMEKQTSSIHLLKTIGEIKGLLVNLYT
ncbi:YaaR family protein [Neobacillus mesonae]|uniref:YaaR family protein n=1 Tax=Neobacillus mesonae TaxID=1193713 RepID=UPI002573149E|nr:YaaR family protein [Neobacillus mesonae]